MKTKEKLGQEPAFPVESKEYGNVGINEIGMSKRFYAACAAMQGILAGSVMDSVINISDAKDIPRDTVIATMAYEFADELLKQES